MSEGIHDVTVAVAIELVFGRTLERCAEIHGSLDYLVHVFDVNEKEEW
jgi:hypothetical protein